ncbi:MAG: PKD domain-containing protein [Bacteroidales bacterium]|nr:PKD domain-containing protein [Bacteroidales bacterium]
MDPVHIYAMAGTYTVSLTITDTAGCINTKTNSVTVTAGPTANFSFSTPACSSTAVTFTDLGNANGTTLNLWHWTFGDGSDTTFTTYHPTLPHTYSQPRYFYCILSLSSQEGCTATVQIPLSISPAPLTDFDFTNTCQALPTQFTDLTSLNGGTILISHAWDFGDPSSGSANTSTAASPTHTFTAPGTYTVTLITQNASGCADTLDKPVTVVPKPGVEFFTDSLTCLGSMTTFFTDTIITPVGAVQAFNWNFGDGTASSNLQNPTHTYTVAGTFNVTLSIADTSGCQNIISHPVTIHNAPASSFTFLSACAEAATQFTDLSLAPEGDTLVSWYWDFNLASPGTDTSALQNPTHTYTLAGTYTVSLTTKTEHGCSDTKTMPLQVWNKPTAHFKYTASPCANGLVQFQDSSWSYQATVTSWNWEFEPYQYGTGQNPTHSYYAVDSCYDVKLMITDLRGCVDTLIKPVCVPPQLTATFTYQQACFSQPMTFSPQLLTPPPAQDSLITFSWNFGDPASGNQNNSTQKHPSHIYSAPGFYTINFTTTDMFGCQATDYQSVQVHALPVAVFSYDPGSCDSTLTFTSASIDTAAAITTLYWDFGDGTLDTLYAPAVSVTHKYSTPGTYTATLTVEDANGCTSTVTDSVRRAPCIVAAYIASDTLLCQNYSLNFSDLSTCDGTISQWVWTWGDTSQPVSYNVYQALTPHTFTQPGTFLVKLKVTTLVGGTPVSDSATRVVTVVSTPLAGFTTENLCLNQPAQFTDTSQSNGATLLTYRWLFDDPLSVYDTAVVRNPSYTYPAPGTYNPQLVLTNQAGCRDTATTAITVYGLPAASFNHSLSCVGQPTLFFDHSDPYLAPLYLWGWRVSDSLDRFIGTMQGDRPEFTFDSAGTYYIRLTASDTNQCADTLSAVVHTRPSPLTAFSYTENVDNVQGQLQFSDGSIGAAEYHWDFGNGEISPAQSPTITYAEDGNYTITLITLNEDGCSDTATMQYNMLFKGLWVPNAFAPGGTWQQTRLWKPVGVNLASYSCQVYNSHGMLIWESKLLDDKGAPSEYWDGTFKGHPVQQDVYVWKIQAIFRDGTIWDNKDVGEHEGMHGEVYGNIVLIR